MSKNIEAGNLYEANKQLVIQNEKPLTHPELAAKQEELEEFFEDQVQEFAMLLCHERRDYTIFQLTSSSTAEHFAAREAIGCCTDRGKILGIDKTNDGIAYEIWLDIDNEAFCYYLFPYDKAVIKC